LLLIQTATCHNGLCRIPNLRKTPILAEVARQFQPFVGNREVDLAFLQNRLAPMRHHLNGNVPGAST